MGAVTTETRPHKVRPGVVSLEDPSVLILLEYRHRESRSMEKLVQQTAACVQLPRSAKKTPHRNVFRDV